MSVYVIWLDPTNLNPGMASSLKEKKNQLIPKGGVTVIPGTDQDTSNHVLPFIFRPASPSCLFIYCQLTVQWQQ